MTKFTLMGATALACLASVPALAQEGGFSLSPAPRWDSADGETSFKLRGSPVHRPGHCRLDQPV